MSIKLKSSNIDIFNKIYSNFCDKRLGRLNKEPSKVIGGFCSFEKTTGENIHESLIKDIVMLHNSNYIVTNNKKISIGAIKLNTISHCIDIFKGMLTVEIPNDIEIRLLNYNSRQILLVRNEIEVNLSDILNRKNNDYLNHHLIKDIVDKSEKNNIIFIVIATSLISTGRDFDFDWGLIDPISNKELIQFCGRIRRHRIGENKNTNVLIFQQPIKFYTGKKTLLFSNPGDEHKDYKLSTYNFKTLLPNILKIDSSSSISKSTQKPKEILSDFDKGRIEWELSGKSEKIYTLDKWINTPHRLCSVFNNNTKFRSDSSTEEFYVDEELKFYSKDEKGNLKKQSQNSYLRINMNNNEMRWLDLSINEKNRIWFSLDYENLIDKYANLFGVTKDIIIKKYCEISIPCRLTDKKNNVNLNYSIEFGLWDTKED